MWTKRIQQWMNVWDNRFRLRYADRWVAGKDYYKVMWRYVD